MEMFDDFSILDHDLVAFLCPHLSVGKNRKFFLYVAEVRRVEMRGSSGLQRIFFPAIEFDVFFPIPLQPPLIIGDLHRCS